MYSKSYLLSVLSQISHLIAVALIRLTLILIGNSHLAESLVLDEFAFGRAKIHFRLPLIIDFTNLCYKVKTKCCFQLLTIHRKNEIYSVVLLLDRSQYRHQILQALRAHEILTYLPVKLSPSKNKFAIEL